MAFKLNDRVKESSSTTGTGTFTLGGAVSGFESFSAGIGGDNTTYYCIFETGTNNFEVGFGTLNSGASTLARTYVISSSNSDAKVDFQGATEVFCTVPGAKIGLPNPEEYGSSSAPKIITVKVDSKTSNHPYPAGGSSSGNAYFLDGLESPALRFSGVDSGAKNYYRFDQSHSSNSTQPLRFYLEADKTTAYTTGVTTNGTAGQSGAYTEISVTDTTPLILHYQCSAHAYMGNAVSSNSNVVNYNDLLNKPTIPSNTNQLTNGAGFIDGSALNASNLSSGTIPDARFPATLPAISGANLTNLPNSGTSTADLLDIALSSNTGGGSASFNGVAYRFKLVTKGTSNEVTPANAEILRVSINGVMQQPNDGTGQGDMTDGYVVSGTDIIFDSPPATGSTYFIITMGSAVSIGNSTTSTLADESSDTTCFPVFATGATGDLALKTGSNFTFNASNGQVTATSYAGDGSNLTGVSSQVADGCITENSLTISNNYTMTTNKSGISAGDIIIASGVTVTIPSGSRYVIV